MLDWTPAKELAKIPLALSYSQIFQLMCVGTSSHPSRTEAAKRVWERFLGNTHILEEIMRAIEFVEELFATEMLIKALEERTRPGRKWAWLSSHAQPRRFPSIYEDGVP